MDFPTITTPEEITPEILDLCRIIDPTQEPVRVPVRPATGALPGSCWFNLEDQVANFGGEYQFGWIIWEAKGLLLQGEFHACWRSPEGELIDITPKEDGEREILFQPDSKNVWTGEIVSNLRYPLSDDPRVKAFIQMNDEYDRVRKANYRPGDRVVIMPEEDVLAATGGAPSAQRISTSARSQPKVGRNEPCPCGSGRKYKKCCLT